MLGVNGGYFDLIMVVFMVTLVVVDGNFDGDFHEEPHLRNIISHGI